jgi:hypothetical protein
LIVAQSHAPAVPASSARRKLISQRSTSAPAGIIATSDGNGIKLDSIVIIAKIPTYHKSEKNPRTVSVIWENMGKIENKISEPIV